MTAPTAEFLVESRKAGADFSHTLTLGHQTLFVSPRRLRRLLRENGLWPEQLSAREFYAEFTESPGYIDPFLQAIGADEVHAMDASPYEGADVVQDLNTPVPEQFKERYTVVFDGGTLEHIFNFPTVKNCMEMLRPGGTLFVNVIANQQFGHGFYQVSPELFFRALAPENGFTVERMHAYEGVMGASSALGLPYEFQWMGPRLPSRGPDAPWWPSRALQSVAAGAHGRGPQDRDCPGVSRTSTAERLPGNLDQPRRRSHSRALW